ncbi:protein-export chaperone SecB [uncultured Sunxiuqinia sp.]|uniref:protein-export chaperone SecB n=1 Tax=uncultured Sunxiuqinia sp. TaxID=1573825 RepID=UPI0026185D29|nr:protein-export chaperone SecB [uncultured Sunxiuqinia sp.]
MEKAKSSKLSFDGFKINRSLINLKGEIGTDMNMEFDASGEINRSNQSFRLDLNIHIKDNSEALNIEIDTSANYKLDEGDIDDPAFSNYLYLNAPAILFPYIRAYITSLTALSGIEPITIPIVNLAGLRKSLEEHTQII